MENTVEKTISRLYADAALHKIRAYEVADAAGIGRNTISMWRNGKASPSLDMFLKARSALDYLINQKADNVQTH